MMKFAAIFTILLSLMGCLAQRSFISLPAAGTKITPGQQITVQVRRPVRMQLSTTQLCGSGFIDNLLTIYILTEQHPRLH